MFSYEGIERRNALRAALACLAVSWLLIKVAEPDMPACGPPNSGRCAENPV